MSNKKQYVLVTLLTGRSFIGFVSDDFSPNFNDDMSFILFNAHYFFTKVNKNNEPFVELLGIEESPEGFTSDMEIMWQSVATVQYLKEDSYLVKNIENKQKDEDLNEEETEIQKSNLIVLNNETNKKKN